MSSIFFIFFVECYGLHTQLSRYYSRPFAHDLQAYPLKLLVLLRRTSHFSHFLSFILYLLYHSSSYLSIGFCNFFKFLYILFLLHHSQEPPFRQLLQIAFAPWYSFLCSLPLAIAFSIPIQIISISLTYVLSISQVVLFVNPFFQLFLFFSYSFFERSAKGLPFQLCRQIEVGYCPTHHPLTIISIH